ncbi:myb-like protein AA isoform X2 [Drosophila kikkawai]|uniref:Myb-like protein AA isoform X2 n=1 Tax=Drosophila kikkawai TaxID=30033 RepID=A0A6P4I711_DROKI|nr:GATA zinc finger domain-containing protein 10 isoform X2 [Drosophila kikkawai]
MDFARNVISLPDEVVIALSRFLANPKICKKQTPGKLYPKDNDDSDEPRSIHTQSSMQSNTHNFQKRASYGCSTNGQASRQQQPSRNQGKLAPSCSKNKERSNYHSPQCPIDSSFHQEEPSVYPCQDQTLRQQLMQLKHSLLPQAPVNRVQQCPQRSARSQSVPRPNANETCNKFERFDCQRGLPAGQDITGPTRGCCAGPNACEGDVPTRNGCNYVPDRNSRSNASSNWHNSSQDGSYYDEWQRRQMVRQGHPQDQQQQQQLQQQQQHQRQSQTRQQPPNECTMSSWEDDEISGFEPYLNSTMIGEEKNNRNSTKVGQQNPIPRQYSSCNNKTCGSNNQSRMYNTSNEIPRRQQQCETPQMSRQAVQCDFQPMETRRKSQLYESSINETSYFDLPEGLSQPNTNKSQCRNSQAMYQDPTPMNLRKQCQMSQRSRSLSPLNCSKCKGQGCGNNRHLNMDDTGGYPEDSDSSRSPTYMNISRAMLARSSLNETSSEKPNSCWAERSSRRQTKSPEDYLAERTQAEFMDALVKDRSCPGVIQSTLNGNEDFNQFAFDIAFAGPVPSKPFPVDPITMLEAIKLRIDYEREEIRRNHRPMTTEDIESHFLNKIKSEVNEGVAAFLKAESQYQANGQPDTFEAQINGLNTNMFDDSIKLNVYSATTQPGPEVLDLSYR